MTCQFRAFVKIVITNEKSRTCALTPRRFFAPRIGYTCGRRTQSCRNGKSFIRQKATERSFGVVTYDQILFKNCKQEVSENKNVRVRWKMSFTEIFTKSKVSVTACRIKIGSTDDYLCAFKVVIPDIFISSRHVQSCTWIACLNTMLRRRLLNVLFTTYCHNSRTRTIAVWTDDNGWFES